PTTYLVDTTLSNSSDSDQTVQAVRLRLVVVNEQDNHDRQRLDSPLVYIGAHNVYYVKSYLSDTK
ncbi:hypothetical protein, partial [Escherichia coli]